MEEAPTLRLFRFLGHIYFIYSVPIGLYLHYMRLLFSPELALGHGPKHYQRPIGAPLDGNTKACEYPGLCAKAAALSNLLDLFVA